MAHLPAPLPPHMPPPPHPTSGENTVGLIGFIVSLIGLVSCGCLAPVGALISLAGMTREPRGFAIAGLVIGIVGMAPFFLIAVPFLLAIIAGGTMAALNPQMNPPRVVPNAPAPAAGQVIVRSAQEQITNSRFLEAENRLRNYAEIPTEAEGNRAIAGLTDGWGGRIHYVVVDDGTAWELRSDGPDRIPGTPDDMTFPDRPGAAAR